jgi:hypothetical protein
MRKSDALRRVAEVLVYRGDIPDTPEAREIAQKVVDEVARRKLADQVRLIMERFLACKSYGTQ